MVRGVSGLRSVVALLRVGSPLTMYRMGLAKGAIGLPLRSMLTKGTCVSVVTTEEGKWLIPSSQNGKAAGSLVSSSNGHYSNARPA